MAKIILNNTEYSIDESTLAPSAADLKSHLSTVMNGSGATINFGGVNYSIDSTKLSAATNDFVSYLRTIAGTGAKVVVGGVEYSVDSTKISGAISDFEAALDNLSGGNSVQLLSSDNLTLQDSNGFSLLAREDN